MPTGIYQRKPMSMETKGKIRIALIGNKNGVGNKGPAGQNPWNKGKIGVYSEETLRSISETQKGKRNNQRTEFKKGTRNSIATEFKVGRDPSLHWNWKNGATSAQEKERKSLAVKKWRNSVFSRDNFSCVSCGERGVRLHADHIKPWSIFPELRLEISNGRTLCVDCHKMTPTFLASRKKLEKMYAKERGSYGA